MYEASFRLRKNSFQLSADPEFLYLTMQHREALAGLLYAILSHKGLVTLIGDAGTGKTTLLAKALRQIPVERLHSSVILNPCLTPAEFLELSLLDFGLESIPASKAQRVWLLQEMLLKTHAQGKTAALIVDEAHKLSPEVLEEIRLLGNFEFSDQKLLQIVLVGQPEMIETLNRTDLRQFKQRIAVRLTIEPLSRAEVRGYMEHRWKQAGGVKLPFEAEATEAVAQWSTGLPRLINSICDNALLTAFGEGSETVRLDHVRAAVADLDLVRTSKGELALSAPPVAPARVAAPRPAPLAPKQHFPVEERMDAPPAPTLSPSVPLSFTGMQSVKPSLFGRWAGRLGFTHQNGQS
jgi:general secretion pathway protein A